MDSITVTFKLSRNFIYPTYSASLYSICDQTCMKSRAFIIECLAKTWKRERKKCALHTVCQLRITFLNLLTCWQVQITKWTIAYVNKSMWPGFTKWTSGFIFVLKRVGCSYFFFRDCHLTIHFFYAILNFGWYSCLK